MTTPGAQGTQAQAGPGRAARPPALAVIPGFGALPAAGLEQAEQACLTLIRLHGRYGCLGLDLPAPLYQCLRDVHDAMDTAGQRGRRRRARARQRAGEQPAPVTATPAREPGCVPPPGYLAVSGLDEITGQDTRALIHARAGLAAPGHHLGAFTPDDATRYEGQDGTKAGQAEESHAGGGETP